MSIIQTEADATVVGRYMEPKPHPGVLTESTLDPGHNELFDLAIARGWSTMALAIQKSDDSPVKARWRAILGLVVATGFLVTALMGSIATDVIPSCWATIALVGAAILVSSLQDILLTTYRADET